MHPQESKILYSQYYLLMQAQKIYISKIAEYQIQETTHYFKPAPPFNKIEV